MEWKLKSFNTKVARRIFTLFIICAILPVTILALLSYINVKKQLNEQSKRLLSQESKTMVVYIYDRLLMLRDEIKFVASNFNSCPVPAIEEILKATIVNTIIDNVILLIFFMISLLLSLNYDVGL